MDLGELRAKSVNIGKYGISSENIECDLKTADAFRSRSTIAKGIRPRFSKGVHCFTIKFDVFLPLPG